MIVCLVGSEMCIRDSGLYDHLRKRFNNVSIKKFKGMRHEIQNEQCKDELLTLMESFISNE